VAQAVVDHRAEAAAGNEITLLRPDSPRLTVSAPGWPFIQALNRQNASVRAAALAERTAEAALAISIIAYRVLEAGG
jgi:hypothetical protein